ncbi:hypothetical protein K502DRAFT_323637 [Neoconidiobolus thromboides FSU 785]|nr:hypothetical protein K502DRAFT_323637 [Neoconidiobolus thromboides FSU 785]
MKDYFYSQSTDQLLQLTKKPSHISILLDIKEENILIKEIIKVIKWSIQYQLNYCSFFIQDLSWLKVYKLLKIKFGDKCELKEDKWMKINLKDGEINLILFDKYDSVKDIQLITKSLKVNINQNDKEKLYNVITEKIININTPEVNLIISSYNPIQLIGYPPLRLRMAEITHNPFKGQIYYVTFLNALHTYSISTQRCGK